MTKVYELQAVATLTMGISPKGSTYNSDGTGMPLLNGPTEFGAVHPVCTLFTTSPVRTCKAGDLLFCVRGSTGRMNWADRPYAIGRGVAAIRSYSPPETRYLRYYLEAHLPSLLKRAGGGTFPNLRQADIATFPILWPDNRNEIAAVLTAYDELIENNTRRIQVLEDMVQALYREWFCEFRFPGHEDVDLVDSELGPIPLGWAIGHFLEICQSVRSPVSPHKEPDAAFYHYSFAAYDRDQTPDVEYGRDVKSSKLKVAQPSVLLAKLNPRIPRVWRAIPPGDLPAYASSEFIVLVPKRTKLTYLYAAASNSEFTRRLAAMSVGTSSSHQRLKVQDFEQMPVVLPPDALVDLYDKHCGPMLELAEKLRQQNANLRTTRDLLLPKLVSGEIDVSDLDIDTDWLVA